MARTAEEIYQVLKKKRKQKAKSSFEILKDKAVKAVNKMLKEGSLYEEFDLEDDDFYALDKVTSEMRELNYRYCLIETQDHNGDIVNHRLRISLAHLEN